MDDITRALKEHYARTFELYGATAKGVDWRDEEELTVRYDKMLAVMQKDFYILPLQPSILDVGCGWGGLLRRANELKLSLIYNGIDVVENMIDYGQKEFPDANFIHGDIFDLKGESNYDFVVCNAILTQKLSVTIPAMESYAKRLVCKMFEQCRHGISFNMMSTRVNFMVDNLYYQNPSELLTWILTEISPRVRLDHGYSSLVNGQGKFYDFTVYIYKD